MEKNEKGEIQIAIGKAANEVCTNVHDAIKFSEGASYGYFNLAAQRLASLQAENEKLWKLLEGEFREKYRIVTEGPHFPSTRETDEAWAAFQKANELKPK